MSTHWKHLVTSRVNCHRERNKRVPLTSAAVSNRLEKLPNPPAITERHCRRMCSPRVVARLSPQFRIFVLRSAPMIVVHPRQNFVGRSGAHTDVRKLGAFVTDCLHALRLPETGAAELFRGWCMRELTNASGMEGPDDDDGRVRQIMAEYGSMLRRVASGYVATRADREALVQDIVIALSHALPSFRGESPERTF